jgi:hypothetical protein
VKAGRRAVRPRRARHQAGLQAVQHGDDQVGREAAGGRGARGAVPGRAVRQEAAVRDLPVRGHGRQELHRVPQAAGRAQVPRPGRIPPLLHLDAQLHLRRRLRCQDPDAHWNP